MLLNIENTFVFLPAVHKFNSRTFGIPTINDLTIQVAHKNAQNLNLCVFTHSFFLSSTNASVKIILS